MTVYTDRETSVHDGEPIECYEFTGTYKTYRYTSGDIPITIGGLTFVPVAIKRTNIKAGVYDEDNIKIDINMPITVGLVKDYGFQITPPRIKLRILRMHRGTDFSLDYAVVWDGFVTNFNVVNNTATLSVPSVFADAMAGSIPSVYFGTPCNNVLFDSGCKVSRAANSIITNVTAISGNGVEIATIGAFPSGAFIGGEVADVNKNDRRMIVAQSGSLLTVNYPFSGLSVGAQVEVTTGCNHGYNSDCKHRYDNQINFGGFPFIPSVNPFESGV